MPHDGGSMRPLLEELLACGDYSSLKVTYNDLHGFHGGLTISINGSGEVEQQALRCAVGEPVRVTTDNIRRLIELLIELQAWQQKEPERMPVPDESRASLTIQVNGRSTLLWEWFNDLSANDRLIRISNLMKEIAWKKSSG